MRRLYGAEQHLLPVIDHGGRPETEWITVHDMEADDIDAVENYFRGGATADDVGAHVGIGRDRRGKVHVRQWADLDALVYHAIGGNSTSVGIECCGYASFSRARWMKRWRFRRELAKALARLCHAYGLGAPIHRGATGNVLGHGDVSARAHVAGGHTDPGPSFPWHAVLSQARRYYRKWYGS